MRNASKEAAITNRPSTTHIHTKFWSIVCSIALVTGLNPVGAFAAVNADSQPSSEADNTTTLVEGTATSQAPESGTSTLSAEAEAQATSESDDEEGTSELESDDVNDTGVWDGHSAVKWTKGSGTESDPYLIESAANFNYLAQEVKTGTSSDIKYDSNATAYYCYSDTYFALACDLDLSAGNFCGIGTGVDNRYFSGNFDGRYHTITIAMQNEKTTFFTGIFAFVAGTEEKHTTIKNFIVKGSVETCSDCAPGYTGTAIGSSMYCDISRIRNEATVHYFDTDYVNNDLGGVAGRVLYGTIDQCSNYGTITGNRNQSIGGIVGYGRCNITNCYNRGDGFYGRALAGIAAEFKHSTSESEILNIYSCYSTSTDYDATYGGGIMGFALCNSSTVAASNIFTNVYWAEELNENYYGAYRTGKPRNVCSEVEDMPLESMKTRAMTYKLNEFDTDVWVSDSRTNPVNDGYPVLAWEYPYLDDSLNISECTISPIADQKWTGSEITPTVTVTRDGEELVEGDDYEVEYANNTDIGTATVTIKGINGAEGSQTLTFEIERGSIAIPTAETGLVYNGNTQTGIAAGDGYTIYGNTATDAGTYYATVTLSDSGSYQWEDGTTAPKKIAWTIERASWDAPVAFTGLTYNGNTLTGVSSDWYYTLSGNTAVNAGNYVAIATVSDTTNYQWAETGTTTVAIPWSIAPRKMVIPTANTGFTYDGTKKVALGSAPAYSLTNNVAFDAGTYVATATLNDTTNYVWEDGTTETKYFTWTIERATIEAPSATTSFTYDALEKTCVEEGTGYTLSGDCKATLPGTYTAIVTPDKNHQWTDGTTDALSISWTITGSIVEVPTVITNFVYNGNTQTASSRLAGLRYTGTTSATEPGSYEFTATPIDGYYWSDGTNETKTYTWSISRISVATPTLNAVPTYDGSSHSGYSYDYTLINATNNTSTNAGGFTATFELKDPTHYMWANGTDSTLTRYWTLERATIAELPTAAQNLVYNGTVQTGVASGSTYTVTTGGTATNAGTYTAWVAPDSNHIWYDGTTYSKSITWSIAKKRVSTPAAQTGLVYNGTEQTAFSSTLYYIATGNTATDAGTYTAKATLINTDNLEWTDGTTEAKSLTWQIQWAPVDLPTAATGLSYDGTEKTGVAEGEGYILSGDYKATLPGTYAAGVTPDSNHRWSDTRTTATRYVSWTITGIGLSVPSPATNLVYDGKQKTGVAAGEGYTLSGTYTATEPGTYTAIVTPDAGYTWGDGTSDAKSVSWTISRITVYIPGPVSVPAYDGTIRKGYSYDSRYIIATGNEATDAGTHTATFSLLDDTHYVWSDGTTDTVTRTWKIERATIDAPTAITGLVYDGSEKTGVTSGEGYTVTNGTATDAGTYTATVTLDSNHQWSGYPYSTSDKTITWSIDKMSVAIPQATTGLAYDGTEKTGVDSSTLYTVANNKATDAGTYTATATLADTANCLWADGTDSDKDIAWSIARATLSVPTALSTTYDGTVKTGVAAGKGYSISGNTATNAGTYTAVATPDANHQWTDGTTGSKSIAWTISRATVAIPTAQAPQTYDGHSKVGLASKTGYSLTGNIATNAGTYTAIATPDANHQWTDGTTGSKSITWVITRKSIAVPTGKTLSYDTTTQCGVDYDEDLYNNGAYSFEGTVEESEPGEYECSVSPTSNYQWADGTTSAVTISWSIVDNREESYLMIERRSDDLIVGDDQYFWSTCVGYEPESYQWQYSSDGGETWSEWEDDPSWSRTLTSQTQESYRGYLVRLVMTTTDGEEVISNTLEWGFGTAKAVLKTRGPIPVSYYQFFTVTLYNIPTGVKAQLYSWYYSKDGGETWSAWNPIKYRTASFKIVATAQYANYLMKCEVKLSNGQKIVTNTTGWDIVTS